MDTETEALVERWITAFCEAPILIDPELMRRVLNDHDSRVAHSNDASDVSCRSAA